MELALRRGTAFFFDCVLLFIVLWPAGLLVQKVMGISPKSGPEVWYTLLVNFSLPVWSYFIFSDVSQRRATIGKRWRGIAVNSLAADRRIGLGRAIVRTAVKLAPWELIHISAFAMSRDMSEFAPSQTVGISVANGLFIGYAVTLLVTRGERSVHDFVARTFVSRNAEKVSV